MPHLVKLTVNLTEKSDRALTRAAELSADKRTDVVNRALQLYTILLEETRTGKPLAFVEEAPDKSRLDIERIRLI